MYFQDSDGRSHSSRRNFMIRGFPVRQYLMDSRSDAQAGVVSAHAASQQRVIFSLDMSHMGNHGNTNGVFIKLLRRRASTDACRAAARPDRCRSGNRTRHGA